jgi:hypothetical protein
VRYKLCLSLLYPSQNVAYSLTSIWSVLRELRIRQAYVQHLESLTMQKDVEKEALQKRVLEQVAGAYKQAQDDAINRLTETSASLQVNRMRFKCPCTDACISSSRNSLCWTALSSDASASQVLVPHLTASRRTSRRLSRHGRQQSSLCVRLRLTRRFSAIERIQTTHLLAGT